MIDITDKELQQLINEFEETFNDVVPFLFLPRRETTEGLKQKIILCLADQKNRLSEFYKFDYKNKKY